MQESKYTFRVDLPVDFDTAIIKTAAALQSEGFGVLSHIDMQETLREKLDVQFKRYHILGVCNPPLAHQALLTGEDLGLLLPANIIVAELENGATRVAAVNPLAAMSDSDSRRLRTIASDVGAKLERVVRSVEEKLRHIS